MRSRTIEVIKWIILLGAIAVALNILFGENTIVFVKRELIQGTTLTWYKYDFNAYIQNLTTKITDTTKLQLKMPPHWFNNTLNAIISVVNYIIFGLNVLLYPLKVGGYIMSFILALIGFNTNKESSLYWLGAISEALLKIEIPFIPLT